MFPQDDKFFKELPFTLPEEQSKPDYVILGTGLQECLLAAHFSKMHLKPGLILDIDKTYGGCLKTVTLKQLHGLATKEYIENLYRFVKLSAYHENNQKFFNECITTKSFRGYNVDIQPNYFFAESPTCELLRQADMDKYMDFRLVSRMLFYNQKANGQKVSSVPLSKGKIFESKNLSLMQKKILLSSFHSLAQIYHKYANVEQDQNSTKQFDKGFGEIDQKLYQEFLNRKQELFLDFLSKKITKNNKKIMEYMIYIICNYQYSYKYLDDLPNFILSEYTLEKFILRFGKFMKSCGIYGEGPYLYVDNGIGDVPQSYSRIASIFGSTYILHPKIQISRVQQNLEDKKIRIYTNLCPDSYIETNKLYYGPTFCQNFKKNNSEIPFSYHKQKILRIIILLQNNKPEGQSEYPAITYLIQERGQITNPIYMFMFDDSSHTCPKGYLLYQLESVLNPKQQEYGDEAIEAITEEIINLLNEIDNTIRDRIKYVTAYIRQKLFIDSFKKLPESQQYILKDHTGIDLDSHFVNFKSVVGSQQKYFRKQNPNLEEENEGGRDYETIELIDRLDAIDLKKEKEKEEIIDQVSKQQINEEAQEEQIKKQAPPTEEALQVSKEQIIKASDEQIVEQAIQQKNLKLNSN